jgi:hypothetical protein
MKRKNEKMNRRKKERKKEGKNEGISLIIYKLKRNNLNLQGALTRHWPWKYLSFKWTSKDNLVTQKVLQLGVKGRYSVAEFFTIR